MGLSGCNPIVNQGRSVLEKEDSGVIFIFISFIINAVDNSTLIQISFQAHLQTLQRMENYITFPGVHSTYSSTYGKASAEHT